MEDLEHVFNSILMMKRLKRQGWFRAAVSISDIESLADHSFGAAIIALVLATYEVNHGTHPHLNIERAALLALIHDLPESQYLDLDITIKQLLGSERYHSIKKDLDTTASKQLTEAFHKTTNSDLLQRLLEELQELSTPEAQLAYCADKTDLLLQSHSYFINNRLNRKQYHNFVNSALQHLQAYSNKFTSVRWFLRFFEALMQ